MADAKSTPSYSSDLHLSVFQDRFEKVTLIFFLRKLFQSTRLYIKVILNGRPATLCLVNSGDVSVFMKFLI